jgi:hypothetical protein
MEHSIQSLSPHLILNLSLNLNLSLSLSLSLSLNLNLSLTLQNPAFVSYFVQEYEPESSSLPKRTF